MALYTEEQLSTILSAHAAGWLFQMGELDWGFIAYGCFKGGCINQVAYNMPSLTGFPEEADDATRWFDNNYKPGMSADELLAALEKF